MSGRYKSDNRLSLKNCQVSLKPAEFFRVRHISDFGDGLIQIFWGMTPDLIGISFGGLLGCWLLDIFKGGCWRGWGGQ